MERKRDIIRKRYSRLAELALLAWLATGSLCGCGQWTGALKPSPVTRGASDIPAAPKLILISEQTITVPLNANGGPAPGTSSTAPNAPTTPSALQPASFTAQPQPQDKFEEIPTAPRRVDRPAPMPAGQPELQGAIAPEVRALPISLDTVLRLAQDQNGNVALAREKVNEAYAQKDLVHKYWLPDIFVGPAYYRHDGGIQDFTGNLIVSDYGSLFAGVELRGLLNLQEAMYKKIDAERNVWQKEGELSRLSSEKLLEASTAYVDLLAALAGAALAGELEANLENLLDKARKLADVEGGANVEVDRIRAAIFGQRQAMRQIRANVQSATAKLAYLLNLDPASPLVPMDRTLVPFTLVHESATLPALVEEALTSGPGIREMEGLLNLIDDAERKSNSLGRFLPVIQMNVADGGFGAGPGGTANWANRFDMALQARWNLSELATARERRRLGDSRAQQAQISYQDLRGKLTLGVQEALESSLSRKEQMGLAEMQIQHAMQAYDKSNKRLHNIVTIKSASASEVLQSIVALSDAKFKYIDAVREYDQAQLRLFVVTGRVDPSADCRRQAMPAEPAADDPPAVPIEAGPILSDVPFGR